MDPLHICIALGPLAVYLLLLGMINMSRRPFVTTGARDTAALGIAVAGFVVAGPMELFLPEAAAVRFGPYIWVMLLAFYGLCLSLLVLLLRPRLVIYNATSDQLRSLLSDVAAGLDREARWAGESLVLPSLGVQLHLEPSGKMKSAQLVSWVPTSYTGWRRLEVAISAALREVQGTPNPYGLSLMFFGLCMMGIITFWMVRDPQTVAQSLREMLRL